MQFFAWLAIRIVPTLRCIKVGNRACYVVSRTVSATKTNMRSLDTADVLRELTDDEISSIKLFAVMDSDIGGLSYYL